MNTDILTTENMHFTFDPSNKHAVHTVSLRYYVPQIFLLILGCFCTAFSIADIARNSVLNIGVMCGVIIIVSAAFNIWLAKRDIEDMKKDSVEVITKGELLYAEFSSGFSMSTYKYYVMTDIKSFKHYLGYAVIKGKVYKSDGCGNYDYSEKPIGNRLRIPLWYGNRQNFINTIRKSAI